MRKAERDRIMNRMGQDERQHFRNFLQDIREQRKTASGSALC